MQMSNDVTIQDGGYMTKDLKCTDFPSFWIISDPNDPNMAYNFIDIYKEHFRYSRPIVILK